MKKILLFTLFLGGSVLLCSAQTNSNNSNFISSDQMKSKKPLVTVNEEPNVDPSKGNVAENKSQTEVTTNGNQYLEYKVDQGSNHSSSLTPVENQLDDKKVTFPIHAEGYTDPNYELNKQKSEELTKQLEAPAVIIKTNEELILDLQNKIKAIKDGEIVGPDATTKLPVYEKELQLLLNTKPTKSCVSE